MTPFRFLFLFDSGADDSFIDETLALQAWLPLIKLAEPCVVQDLDGCTKPLR